MEVAFLYIYRYTNNSVYYMVVIIASFPYYSMGITAEMLRPFLEGWTLKQIIEAKRLFVVDHKILQDLPTREDAPVRLLIE